MHRFFLIGSAIALTIGLFSPVSACADEPTYRSLRDARPRVPDELDRPRRAHRVSHRGWEVRSAHFVVVATTGPTQAEMVSRQLEETWRRFGHLADTWTDVHRQPNFAIGAVGVLIDDAAVNSRQRPDSGPRALNHGANIYINLASGEPTLDDQLPRIRSEAVRAFLRVTGQDAVLPDWVVDGLAVHFARRDPTPSMSVREQTPANGTVGATALPRAGQRLTQRIAADRMETPAPHDTDPLSVRFLLEADDAHYAPAFLAALAESARHDLPVHPEVGRRVGRGKSTRGLPKRGRWQIARLTGGADYRREFEKWQSDPLAGRPIFEPAEIDGPRLLAQAQRMTLVLKLARRFDVQAASSRGTAIDLPRSPQTDESFERSGRALDLQGLYRRLTDPAAEPWATIDVDGTLLWSGNRARIDEIFRAADVRYTTHLRRGQSVLEARLETGERLEAWLEPNDENPTRPIARVRRITEPSGSAWAPARVMLP